MKAELDRPNSAKFPVFFLVSRELSGERFARDCILRHQVVISAVRNSLCLKICEFRAFVSVSPIEKKGPESAARLAKERTFGRDSPPANKVVRFGGRRGMCYLNRDGQKSAATGRSGLCDKG